MENSLSKIVVNTCYQVHVGLGPGLFESVYEEVLHYEFVSRAYKLSGNLLCLLCGVGWR
jgi:GxxExxY protein